MRVAALAVVGVVGVAATILCARGWWRAHRGGASEVAVGYLVLMVFVSAVSIGVLRVL